MSAKSDIKEFDKSLISGTAGYIFLILQELKLQKTEDQFFYFDLRGQSFIIDEDKIVTSSSSGFLIS